MLGWAGFLVGILGVVLAVVFYYQAQRDARPVAKIVTGRILGPVKGLRRGWGGGHIPLLSPDDLGRLEITYDDESITELDVTFVAIWNAGNGALDHASLVELDPLRLIFSPEVKIVDLKVIAEVAANGLAVSQPDLDVPEVHITFDFLNSGDGAIVRVLHNASPTRPKLAGRLRDVPGGVRTIPGTIGDFAPKGRPWRVRVRHAAIVTAIATVIPLIAAIPIGLSWRPEELWFTILGVPIMVALLLIPAVWLSIWATRNVIPREIRLLNRLATTPPV